MNDRWRDVADAMVEDALTELLAVQDAREALAAGTGGGATAAALDARAAELSRRIGAAGAVLAAYGGPHADPPGLDGGGAWWTEADAAALAEAA